MWVVEIENVEIKKYPTWCLSKTTDNYHEMSLNIGVPNGHRSFRWRPWRTPEKPRHRESGAMHTPGQEASESIKVARSL